MPAYQGMVTGAGAADILAFKSTMSDLEARLQKHIEFRERVRSCTVVALYAVRPCSYAGRLSRRWG